MFLDDRSQASQSEKKQESLTIPYSSLESSTNPEEMKSNRTTFPALSTAVFLSPFEFSESSRAFSVMRKNQDQASSSAGLNLHHIAQRSTSLYPYKVDSVGRFRVTFIRNIVVQKKAFPTLVHSTASA